jgi:hypothetical protein
MARNVRLLIFQPIEAPFSSTLPPATVKLCQNLRRTRRPSTTVNSQSRLRTSLPGVVEALSSPLSIANAAVTADVQQTMTPNFAKLASVKMEVNEMNPNEMVEVNEMNSNEMADEILDIAPELFRCHRVLPSSQTVPPSLYSPSPAMNLRGRLFPGVVMAEGAGRRWPIGARRALSCACTCGRTSSMMGATGTASTRTWGAS